MLKYHFTALLLVVVLLSACASTRPYTDTLAKNLTVTTKTDSGSFISSIVASLDIYRVNNKCEASYQGTVALVKGKLQVGLPTSQISYLVFRFNSSSFLASSSSVISSETLLKARKSRLYEADVRYIDGIYNVEILEKRSRKSKGKEVAHISLNDCQRL